MEDNGWSASLSNSGDFSPLMTKVDLLVPDERLSVHSSIPCRFRFLFVSGGELPAHVQRLPLQTVPVVMEKAGDGGGAEEDCGVVTRSVEGSFRRKTELLCSEW